MTRGVSAGLNAVLGRWLPEQRLFAKTDDRTRVARLSPASQLFGGVCLAALIGWSGYLTADFIAEEKLNDQLVDADERLVEIYEMRIARLEDEKRRLADSLSEKNAALTTIATDTAKTHTSLGDALTTISSLSATETSHRSQMAEMASVQSATLDRCDALDTQLSAIMADKALLAQELTAADAALHDLSAALSETADARDNAETAAGRLTTEVAALRAEFDLRRDQQNRLMARLEDATRLSLGSLETVFDKTGVDLDNVLAEVRRDYSGSGGLFIPLDANAGFDGSSIADENHAANATDAPQAERIASLLSDMERINSMRIAIENLPLTRPVGAARLSSRFGPRKDPINGRNSFHAGMDFAAPRGTAIFAAGAGEVVYSGRQRGYGKIIKIRHAFGYETVYAHLNRRRVNVGDKVERGDRIGDMGNTGRSTGTHLHYEIRVNGKTVNPAKYIEAARNVL